MTANQTTMEKRRLPNSSSPSAKRVKMSKSDELDLVDMDPTMELEKKRQASRESSRRTRERERSRVDYFKANKLRLEGDNEKIRAENERLRRLIQLIKEGTAKKYSTAMVTPQPVHVQPKMVSPPVIQQTPQLQQMLLMSLLSSSMVAKSNQTQATQIPVVAPAPSTTVDQSQLLSILSSLTSTTGSNAFQAPTDPIPLFQGAQ